MNFVTFSAKKGGGALIREGAFIRINTVYSYIEADHFKIVLLLIFFFVLINLCFRNYSLVFVICDYGIHKYHNDPLFSARQV